MTADEALRALTAARALVERSEAAGSAGSAFTVRLSGCDRAILAGYERARREGWLRDDRARHAVGLRRSAIGLLEWFCVRAEAQADPTGVISRLMEHLRRTEHGPTPHGAGSGGGRTEE